MKLQWWMPVVTGIVAVVVAVLGIVFDNVWVTGIAILFTAFATSMVMELRQRRELERVWEDFML